MTHAQINKIELLRIPNDIMLLLDGDDGTAVGVEIVEVAVGDTDYIRSD